MEKKIYNVTKWLSGVFAIFVLYFFLTGSGDYQKYLVYDNSIALGDTIISPWTPINGSKDVSLFFSVGDTTWAKVELEYRYGSDVAIYNILDTMSLDTRATTLAGKSVGKIFQGFGLATSLIPGANAIRVRTIMKSATSASSYIHVGMVYGD